jgi:ribosomal protein S1
MVTPTAQSKRGRVREVTDQGVLFASPSKIKAVILSKDASNEANLIPEKSKLWLGDNLASTENFLHSTLKNLKKTIETIFAP